MNPDLVNNIKVRKNPITMQNNAGSRKIVLKGQVGDKIKARFDPGHITNMFGFTRMTDKYEITYDSDKEDTFIMQTNNGIIKFSITPEGLYVYKPPDSYLNHMAESKFMSPPMERSGSQLSIMISTVTENHKGYTQRQSKNSKIARQLYHVFECPTVDNYNQLLQQNIIRDCPVKIEDVNIAEKIYRANIGELKGKTIQNMPTPVKNDFVEFPTELIEQHRDLIYCMDVMYVKKYDDADWN